jgi:hypothetical protein
MVCFVMPVIRHKRKLNSSATIKDDEIRAYYDKNKRDFVKAGMSKVKMISIPYSLTNEGASKSDAEQLLQEIVRKLDAGEDFKVVTDGYCKNQPSTYNCKEQVFDATTARMDAMTAPALALAAKGLHKDEISGVIEEGKTLNLLKSMEKQEETLLPLNEVKKGIAQKLGYQAFDRFLQDQISQVELIVNDEVLKSVEVKVLLEK